MRLKMVAMLDESRKMFTDKHPKYAREIEASFNAIYKDLAQRVLQFMDPADLLGA